MESWTWETLDKSKWGDGPWQSEADKYSWTDQATDLPCLIVRGPAGAWCGYVGITEGHPAFEKTVYDLDSTDLDSTVVDTLDVHGGVTYSAFCAPEEDVGHGICHVPEPGKSDHVWWIGFDCHHSYDVGPGYVVRLRDAGMPDYVENGTYRTVAYVMAQCSHLAAQLKELS